MSEAREGSAKAQRERRRHRGDAWAMAGKTKKKVGTFLTVSRNCVRGGECRLQLCSRMSFGL